MDWKMRATQRLLKQKTFPFLMGNCVPSDFKPLNEVKYQGVISEIFITFQMVSLLSANLFLSKELLNHYKAMFDEFVISNCCWAISFHCFCHYYVVLLITISEN